MGRGIFHTLLFKIFNRISTWQLLTTQLGQVSWSGYEFSRYDKILGDAPRLRAAALELVYLFPSRPSFAPEPTTARCSTVLAAGAGLWPPG